jgi:hypothetical protein
MKERQVMQKGETDTNQSGLKYPTWGKVAHMSRRQDFIHWAKQMEHI